jgi:DNA-binding NarL/FixJ family response regulator
LRYDEKRFSRLVAHFRSPEPPCYGPRRAAVFALLLLGVTCSKDIGRILGISAAAVDLHVSAELRARGLGSRTELGFALLAEAASAGVVGLAG